MKKLLALTVVFLVLFSPVSGGVVPKKIDDAKKESKHLAHEGVLYNVDHLDKAWGLTLKSVQVKKEELNKGTSQIRTTLLLEFNKDVDDLKGLYKVFTGPNSGLAFYLFDKDNVVIGKVTMFGTEGELTGKKGDAFRLVLQTSVLDSQTFAKMEARSTERPPETKKGK
jgi:hypothetical protein